MKYIDPTTILSTGIAIVVAVVVYKLLFRDEFVGYDPATKQLTRDGYVASVPRWMKGQPGEVVASVEATEEAA